MSITPPIRVLFVCMGNICRSPMAEAVFRHLAAEAGLDGCIAIDSAGTGGWHAGEPPHSGTQAVLREHQIAVGSQRARQLRASDAATFTYIVAMDEENLRDMARLFPQVRARASLLLGFAPAVGIREVPDPYYDGRFAYVYQLVDAGCRGLLAHIRQEHGL
jgi:protein-tyrosine phosphatase